MIYFITDAILKYDLRWWNFLLNKTAYLKCAKNFVAILTSYKSINFFLSFKLFFTSRYILIWFRWNVNYNGCHENIIILHFMYLNRDIILKYCFLQFLHYIIICTINDLLLLILLYYLLCIINDFIIWYKCHAEIILTFWQPCIIN